MENEFPATPVFVVGSQRSGTTLVGERLGRHPSILTTPESQFFKQLLRHNTALITGVQAERMVCDLLADFRFWTFGLNIYEQELRNLVISHTGNQILERLLSNYSKKVNRPNFDFWIEHSPENFKDIPWLFEHFPKAKAIHVIRDGRGVFNSFRSLQWGPHSARRTAEYWQATNFACEILQRKYPERIISIRFEDLIDNEDHQLENVFSFLNVANADKQGKSDNLGSSLILPTFTKKQHQLVEKNIQPGRKLAWKTNLPDRDVELFTYYAALALHYFGYIDDLPREPPQHSLFNKLCDHALDAAKIGRSKLSTYLYERRFVQNAAKKTPSNTRA